MRARLERMPDWLRTAPPYALVVLGGTALNAAAFWPGYMSNDSLQQLAAARGQVTSDWHPPVMTLLWRLIDSVWPGPQGMVILHNLWFWTAVALLAHLATRRWYLGAPLAALIGLYPPFFSLLGTVWKDVGMGCALLMSVALLLAAQRWRARWALGLAVPFLFYALSVRHEGLMSVGPLALWAGLVARDLGLWPRFLGSTARALAAGLALCVGLFLANSVLVRVSTHGKKSYPEQVILVYDLAFMSQMTGEWLLPAHFTTAEPPEKQVAELKTRFEQNGCNIRYCFPMLDWFPIDGDEARVKALRARWVEVLKARPADFVRMKAKLFLYNYSFRTETVAYAFHHGVDPNDLGVTLRKSKLNDRVMAFQWKVLHTAMFRPWIVLALTLLMVLALLVARAGPFHPAVIVGASALAKELVYLLFWSGNDFRYHWWTVMAVFAMPLITLAVGLRQRTAVAEEPAPRLEAAVTPEAGVARPD